jgi:UDP-N-acetylglucosamine 1-carboxyvinyltransferase
MGADVTVKGKTATVKGVKALHGANVCAGDLRGGAALVIAALAAEGKTSVLNAHHVKRGYYNFDEKLRSLGAKINLVED